jgi:hypothetical protein
MKNFILKILFFLISINLVVAQNNQRNPLDYETILSGTFGELRSNHFHSGIDIKTKGKEGSKVYAFSKGYVSRIKISKVDMEKLFTLNIVTEKHLFTLI